MTNRDAKEATGAPDSVSVPRLYGLWHAETDGLVQSMNGSLEVYESADRAADAARDNTRFGCPCAPVRLRTVDLRQTEAEAEQGGEA